MLADLPSLVLRVIAEQQLEGMAEGSLANFSICNKTIRDAVSPILWEACRWGVDYDWHRTLREGSDMLRYIRQIGIASHTWKNGSDDDSSWALLSKCESLETIVVDSNQIILLPPPTVIFPHLAALEIGELPETSEEELAERAQSNPELYPADGSISFPALNDLGINGYAEVIGWYIQQIHHTGDAEKVTPWFRREGVEPRGFKSVEGIALWVTQDRMPLPSFTLTALCPNALVAEIELVVVHDVAVAREDGRSWHHAVGGCVPELALESGSLEEIDLRCDIRLRLPKEGQPANDTSDIRFHIDERQSPNSTETSHTVVSSANVRRVIGNLCRECPNLATAVVQWPEWMPPDSHAEVMMEQETYRKFTMTRTIPDGKQKWTEARKSTSIEELRDQVEEEKAWEEVEEPDWEETIPMLVDVI